MIVIVTCPPRMPNWRPNLVVVVQRFEEPRAKNIGRSHKHGEPPWPWNTTETGEFHCADRAMLRFPCWHPSLCRFLYSVVCCSFAVIITRRLSNTGSYWGCVSPLSLANCHTHFLCTYKIYLWAAAHLYYEVPIQRWPVRTTHDCVTFSVYKHFKLRPSLLSSLYYIPSTISVFALHDITDLHCQHPKAPVHRCILIILALALHFHNRNIRSFLWMPTHLPVPRLTGAILPMGSGFTKYGELWVTASVESY